MSWRGVRAAFERLIELPEAEREAELAKLDPETATEVRALLASDSDAGAFLERARTPPVGASAAPAHGERLGRFELVRPLGSGGMGTVWEARQAQPERRVALKILASRSWSRAERWRFEYEAQVLATLNHPAIAQLYEVGSETRADGDVAWFAMELVEDARDLIGWAAEHGADRDARLATFAELCDAVQYGHRRGVIHRDLKPANVLVGRDGRLKLIDFGVARAVDGSSATPSLRTHTGELVGTLQYMAPEQLAGRNDQIDARCDVYALGVILYHLLCGEAPFDFRGASLARVAELVQTEEPRRPSALRPELAGDLEWILLRALEKDPARRYQSVADFAEDLRRFRDHEPVSAHAPSFVYRARKYLRRHRAAAGITLAAALGIAVALGGLVSGMRQAQAGEKSALDAAAESRRQTERAQREAARNSHVLAVVENLFRGVEDTVAGREVRVADLLDAAAFEPGAIADPSVEFAVRAVRGAMYHRLQDFERARIEFERAIELFPRTEGTPLERQRWLICRSKLGQCLTRVGLAEQGEAELRAVVAETEHETNLRVRFEVLDELCTYLKEKGADAELLEVGQRCVELARANGDEDEASSTETLVGLALQGLGRELEALPILERVWRRSIERYGAHSSQTANATFNYATALHFTDKLDEAEQQYEVALALSREFRGPDHNQTLTILTNQAMVSMARGDRAVAIERLRPLVEAYDRRPGTPTLEHLLAINNLGMLLNVPGRQEEAEPYLRRAAQLATDLLAPDDVNVGLLRLNHGACLAWLKRWDESEPILLSSFQTLVELLPAGHENLGKAIRTIADAYKANGFPEKSDEWRAKL
ncbi:MAG: serine/threonine protein kinase [Planctomycetes bacterium]|nr:serine/threonine protein kinase [Planctomycetota bacterium]